MTTKVLNVGNHSIDLDSGRVLAPGEKATVDIDDPHNKSLLEQGHILVVEPKSAAASEEKPKTAAAEDNKREDNKS